MIKNDRQLVYSKKQLNRLFKEKKYLEKKYSGSPSKLKLFVQGYREHIHQISEEISDYEQIKKGNIPNIVTALSIDNLREQLIRLRIVRGYTQLQLAKKINCKQSDISRFERKGYSGSIETLERIAKALGTSIEFCLNISLRKSIIDFEAGTFVSDGNPFRSAATFSQG